MVSRQRETDSALALFILTNKRYNLQLLGVYNIHMHTNSQNILISLPKQLLNAADIVKNERQISRSAFIRESLLRNIRYYEKYERGRVGCQLDDPEFNCGGHFEKLGGASEEDSRPVHGML